MSNIVNKFNMVACQDSHFINGQPCIVKGEEYEITGNEPVFIVNTLIAGIMIGEQDFEKIFGSDNTVN